PQNQHRVTLPTGMSKIAPCLAGRRTHPPSYFFRQSRRVVDSLFVKTATAWSSSMMKTKRIFLYALAGVLIVGGSSFALRGQSSPRPMSFSNRLLLNRAFLAKEDRLEVMLVTDLGKGDQVKEAVTASGGTIVREDAPTGYLRVEIPMTKLTTL